MCSGSNSLSHGRPCRAVFVVPVRARNEIEVDTGAISGDPALAAEAVVFWPTDSRAFVASTTMLIGRRAVDICRGRWHRLYRA